MEHQYLNRWGWCSLDHRFVQGAGQMPVRMRICSGLDKMPGRWMTWDAALLWLLRMRTYWALVCNHTIKAKRGQHKTNYCCLSSATSSHRRSGQGQWRNVWSIPSRQLTVPKQLIRKLPIPSCPPTSQVLRRTTKNWTPQVSSVNLSVNVGELFYVSFIDSDLRAE
jgi:hypothetical protein